MVLRLAVLLVCVLAGVAGYSQENTQEEAPKKEKKKTFRPDIPGSIMIELGINVKNGVTPPEFQKGFWGSRTFNIYYQYPIRLFKTSFSLNPGIGLSLERWKFTNNYTLGPKPDPDGSFSLVPATNFYTGTIERSFLVNNYIEMPLELRWDTNPEDIARSFNVSFGGRVGWLYDSFTKVDYKDGSEDKVNKDKQWHGMNQFRYGLYGRIGISGLSFFGYYNASPMFEANKGPGHTTMNSWTFGISVNGF